MTPAVRLSLLVLVAAAPALSAPSAPPYDESSGEPGAGGASEATPLARFGAALRQLEAQERERVAVGVFGASHVERQRLTNRLRRRLQERFGGRGRGFIDPSDSRRVLRPGRVARRVLGRYALETGHGELGAEPVLSPSGHRLVLHAGARAEIDTCARCRRSSDDAPGIVELTWWQDDDTAPATVMVNGVEVGHIEASAPGLDPGAAPAEVRSIRVPVRGLRHRVQVVVDAEAGERRLVLLGAVFERRAPGVVVDALGLSGSTGGQLGSWNRAALDEQVQSRAYDLVVFAWGTNDILRRRDEAAYAEALRRSMRTVLDASPGADCVYVGPTDRQRARDGRWRTPPGYDVVHRVQRALAAEHGCSYIDARRLMGGRGSVARWVERGLADDDRTHLTGRGYRRLADRILERVFDDSGVARRSTGRLARGR